MENCTSDCIAIVGNFSSQKTCGFVKEQCVQSTLQFVQGYYCGINESFCLLLILGIIIVGLLYAALNMLAEKHLTTCVHELIDKLSKYISLGGSTLLAFANGAPDVITAIVAGNSSQQSTSLIPFGSLFGAGLVDMAFVFAMSIGWCHLPMLEIQKVESLYPLCFYLAGTLFIIAVSVFYGKMNMFIAGVPFVLYVGYIVVILREQRKYQKDVESERNVLQSNKDNMKSQISQIDTEYQLTEKSINGKQLSMLIRVWRIVSKGVEFMFEYTVPPITAEKWSPLKTSISLFICPWIFIFNQGVTILLQSSLFHIPLLFYCFIPSLIFLGHTAYLYCNSAKLAKAILYTLYAFVIVICWLAVICSLLINILELIQLLTRINTVFLGLTVIAWTNCMGDYLSVSAFMKRGNYSTAVSFIFSGQLFNFLIGFGASLMIRSISGQYSFKLFQIQGDPFTIISLSIIIFVIIASLLYVCLLTIFIFFKKGKFEKKHGRIIKTYYIAFVVGALAVSIASDLNRTINCSL